MRARTLRAVGLTGRRRERARETGRSFLSGLRDQPRSHSLVPSYLLLIATERLAPNFSLRRGDASPARRS